MTETTTIMAPDSRIGTVIGPRGGTIDNIRKIYQVRIDIPRRHRKNLSGCNKPSLSSEDTVPIKIQGHKDQVDLAVQAIEGLIASNSHISPVHKHETTIDIPQEFHADLIGKGGKNVGRLERRYQVRIIFGGPMGDRKMGESVLIRGQQYGVEFAREEILELYKFVFEERKAREIKPGLVWVSKNSIGGIIGHQGDMIQAIQRETNTTIHLLEEEDWAPGTATVRLIGGDNGIATAMRRIRGIEAKISREITTEIRVDPQYYRGLIGSGGQTLRSIIVQAGGPLDAKAQARAVRFPRSSDNSDLVKLYGDPEFVRRIETELERRVAELKHC